MQIDIVFAKRMLTSKKVGSIPMESFRPSIARRRDSSVSMFIKAKEARNHGVEIDDIIADETVLVCANTFWSECVNDGKKTKSHTWIIKTLLDNILFLCFPRTYQKQCVVGDVRMMCRDRIKLIRTNIHNSQSILLKRMNVAYVYIATLQLENSMSMMLHAEMLLWMPEKLIKRTSLSKLAKF